MKSANEVVESLIAKLAAEGIEAFATVVDTDDITEGEPTIRVPVWENDKGDLSRNAVYGFIHTKLQGERRKGFQCKLPATGDNFDLYCYDPDEDGELKHHHLMTWNTGEPFDRFDWTGVVMGDDVAWYDGWEMYDCDELVQRVAFLASLLDCEIVDLPPVRPLSRQELSDKLKALLAMPYPDHISCCSSNPNSLSALRFDQDGNLVIWQQFDDSLTMVKDEHFDEKGRLVIDGHVFLTRAMIPAT